MKRAIILLLLVVSVPALDIGRYLFFPDVSLLKDANPERTSFMNQKEEKDRRQGKEISMRQRWVPLRLISTHLVNAVLIAEDDKFWMHDGFDFEAMGKAMQKNIDKRRASAGASTITQQLAKNLYLTPEKNPVRKLKEAILTWRMERTLGKERILEIYLNVVEWGEAIYGAEAASRRYYEKSAAELNPHEAVRLAAALPNPRRYSPTGDSRYVENRAGIIYDVMVRRGLVPEASDGSGEQTEPTAPTATGIAEDGG
jgi:monofunctional biosynthetic peptidoglycan transglycosylase